MTGGRLKRLKGMIDGTFIFTYGDGLSNINITKLIDFHKEKKTKATVTVVQPPGRFGNLDVQNNRVTTSYVKIQSMQNVNIPLPTGYSNPVIVPSNDYQKMCKCLPQIV